MIWNPWKRIRELELALADRDARLDVAYEQLEDAEGRAWDRAARHWQYQLERSRETEKAAMLQLSQIASATPWPLTIMKDLTPAP